MLALVTMAVASTPDPLPFAKDAEVDALRLVVVGDLPSPPHRVADAIVAREPDVVVLTGVDAREDLSVLGISDDRPVIAVGDAPPRKRWLKRFDGIGVQGLGKTVPYGSVDYVIGETRWRVLYVTAWTEPGEVWEEQSFWLPKALDRSAYDRLLVVTDGPVHSLSEGPPGARGAERLLEVVQEHADPLSFVAIISGNTGTNEVFAPGGRYGELHLVAGDSGGVASPFSTGVKLGGIVRRGELEPAYRAALESMGLGPAQFDRVSGFWTLDLQGPDVVLDFWMRRDRDWEIVFRLVRDRKGWHLP